MSDLQPLSLWHLVELLPAGLDRQTPTGIFLPDQWWSRQDSSAIVLRSGPGLDLDGYGTLPPAAQPGDLVLLDAGDFHPLRNSRRGFIADTRLVAWLQCNETDPAKDRPVPLNDWVLIAIDDRPTRAGNIALPDSAARPRSGVTLDVGPGRFITCGEHKGDRQSVEDICGFGIIGRRVHWGREAEVVCCGRYALQWVLLRAGDLIAVETGQDLGPYSQARIGELVGGTYTTYENALMSRPFPLKSSEVR